MQHWNQGAMLLTSPLSAPWPQLRPSAEMPGYWQKNTPRGNNLNGFLPLQVFKWNVFYLLSFNRIRFSCSNKTRKPGWAYSYGRVQAESLTLQIFMVSKVRFPQKSEDLSPVRCTDMWTCSHNWTLSRSEDISCKDCSIAGGNSFLHHILSFSVVFCQLPNMRVFPHHI